MFPLGFERDGGRKEEGDGAVEELALARFAPSGSLTEALSGSGSASPASKKTSVDGLDEERNAVEVELLIQTVLDQRDAESSSTAASCGVRGVQEVSEQEADKLERHGYQQIPSKAKEVANGKPFDDEILDCTDMGPSRCPAESIGKRVDAAPQDGGLPVLRHCIGGSNLVSGWLHVVFEIIVFASVVGASGIVATSTALWLGTEVGKNAVLANAATDDAGSMYACAGAVLLRESSVASTGYAHANKATEATKSKTQPIAT